MKDIKTIAELHDVLDKNFALCFVFMDKYIPSQAAKTYLLELERLIKQAKYPKLRNIYQLRPWAYKHIYEWIYTNPVLQYRNEYGELTCLARRGTLIWLAKGKVLHVERQVLKKDIRELWETTEFMRMKHLSS